MAARQRNMFRQASAQKYQPYMQAQGASPLGWLGDLSSTGSGLYGSFSGGGGSGSCFSIDICPDLILAAIAAAAAAAAFIIYQAITVAGRRRRKKRDDDDDDEDDENIFSTNLRIQDLLHLGSYLYILHAIFLHPLCSELFGHVKDFSLN